MAGSALTRGPVPNSHKDGTLLTEERPGREAGAQLWMCPTEMISRGQTVPVEGQQLLELGVEGRGPS